MNEACRSSSKLGRIASRRRIDRVSNGSFHDSGFSRATLCRGVLPIGEIRLINGEVGCNTNEVRYRLLKCWRVSGIERYRNPIESHSCTLHAGIAYPLSDSFPPSFPPSPFFSIPPLEERWTSSKAILQDFPNGSSNLVSRLKRNE